MTDTPHRTLDISIHALHEESDGDYDNMRLTAQISIHALHEESDLLFSSFHNCGGADFNPRSP